MGKIKVKRIRLMAVITVRNTPFTKSMRTLLSERRRDIKRSKILCHIDSIEDTNEQSGEKPLEKEAM